MHPCFDRCQSDVEVSVVLQPQPVNIGLCAGVHAEQCTLTGVKMVTALPLGSVAKTFLKALGSASVSAGYVSMLTSYAQPGYASPMHACTCSRIAGNYNQKPVTDDARETSRHDTYFCSVHATQV